jgi:ABC-type lipoprotein release transport system permease subunit
MIDHVFGISMQLAWRNLWRNHRRTIIMLGAISIGAWAMIFLTALTQGMVTDMVEDGLAVLPGHVQVHHPDYRDDPTVSNLVPVPDSELERRFQDADVLAWATRVKVPAVIMSERETRGVTLLGIDPRREMPFTFIDLEATAGRFLESPDDRGLVLGQKLVEELETELGKRVVIMSQDLDNEVADRGFRIVGVFRADRPAHEEAYALIGKRTAQEYLGIGDSVSEAVAFGDDFRDVTAVRAAVDAVIDADSGAVVNNWPELDRYLGTTLAAMDGFVLIWVIVIFLALSFGLVNTLMMAVFERVREIGVMLALGVKPTAILLQIVFESMLLLALGLAIGNALAWASVQPIKDGIDISMVAEGMEMMGASSRLVPDLRLQDVVLANGVVLLLGFLASIVPAWRASRYEPVEAITKVD